MGAGGARGLPREWLLLPRQRHSLSRRCAAETGGSSTVQPSPTDGSRTRVFKNGGATSMLPTQISPCRLIFKKTSIGGSR
jgi:hypothetical protein